MMAQLPEEWKSKRAKTKKSGAGTKRPGFGSRYSTDENGNITFDMLKSVKDFVSTIPCPFMISPLEYEFEYEFDMR